MPRPSSEIDGTGNTHANRDDGVYEGIVTLSTRVDTSGVLQMVHFVAELRRRSEFRLMRLLQNADGVTDILLALREPLHMKEILLQIPLAARPRNTVGECLGV